MEHIGNDCARSRTRVIGDEEEIKNGVEYIKGLWAQSWKANWK